MDAPQPQTAPPTTPGPIPDPRAGRLPIAAKTVASLDVLFGAMMLFSSVYPPGQFNPYGVAFGVMFPLGIGVLLRSNLARILARIAHGLFGGLFILAMVFTAQGFLSGGGQGPSTPGGLMIAMMAFLLAWTLGVTAFFVWGFFVLGRNDVRAACRRRSRAKQAG